MTALRLPPRLRLSLERASALKSFIEHNPIEIEVDV